MNHVGVGLVCSLLLMIQYGNGATLNITSPNASPNLLIGDTINLTISYGSTPSLIMWTFNHTVVVVWADGWESLTPEYSSRVTLGQDYLLINGSTPADSGQYNVSIYNTVGDYGMFSFNVVVKDRVQKIRSNDTGFYKTGENISLTIEYNGITSAIFWDYNKTPLVIETSVYKFRSPTIINRMTLSDRGSLVIYNTSKEDAGNYSVVVKTDDLPGSLYFLVKFYDPLETVTVTQSPLVVSEQVPLANLTCKALSGVVEEVIWKKDEDLIINNSSFRLLDGNQTLQIVQPKGSFTGVYTCNMSNPVYSASGTLSLRVYDPVMNVVVTQSPKVVSESDSSVSLSCSASSGYVESVTWMKNGKPLDDTYTLLNGNLTLQIIKPNRTFSGNYSCHMSNVVYNGSGNIWLQVYDPVVNVTVTQSPEVVSEGNSLANLRCRAASGVTETVTWQKDGKAIIDDDSYTLLDGNQTLQINNPNVTFSGTYQCKVSNAVYSSSGSHNLIVYDLVENVEITQSTDVVSVNTNAVNLTCNAPNIYIESVKWLKDGAPIDGSFGTTLLEKDHILHIIKPNTTFIGNYSCNISNAASWNVGYHLLKVYDPVTNVKVSQTPDNVNDKTDLVTLGCSASTTYVEEVTWTKDNKSLTGSAFTLSDGNLTLKISKPNTTFSGIYTCKVSNAAFFDTGSRNLTVSHAALSTTCTFGMMITSLLAGILLAH